MQLRKKKIGSSQFEITLNNKVEILQTIDENWQRGLPMRIVTLNPEMLIAAKEKPNLHQAIQSAEAIIPDGIGIILLLQKLGIRGVKRLPGIELAWELLNQAIKYDLQIALIGSTDQSLRGAIDKIQKEIGKPNLIYSRNGFFGEKDEVKIIEVLLELQPSLLLIAMPFERQEIFLHNLTKRGFRGISIGIGGSFDVWAGLVDRAPKFLQLIGLEWLWRILKQPARITRLSKVLIPFGKIYMDEH
jgi:N-acetylglucosaminyldiphosphoundecaprenol N-acetyl-beta-D-mannosaminyltransferase